MRAVPHPRWDAAAFLTLQLLRYVGRCARWVAHALFRIGLDHSPSIVGIGVPTPMAWYVKEEAAYLHLVRA